MLRKIIIENFQSHKKTIIEFDNGVNAFIGDTDCGKSAVMRAINWVNNNRPLGTSFISDWDDYCQVTIETDKDIITRKKTNTFNGYIVNGKEFDGIGNAVPEQVTNALNLSDINIQSQFDNHFLVASSPGSVAEYLNTVVDLQVIDDSIDRVNKKLKNIKSDIKIKEKNVEDYKNDIRKMSFIDELQKEIETLNELQKEIDALEKAHDEILMIDEKLEELYNKKELQKDFKIGLEIVDKLIEDSEDLEELDGEYSEIDDILSELQELIDRDEEIDYTKGLEEVDSIIKENLDLKEDIKTELNLQTLLAILENAYMLIKDNKENIVALKTELLKYKDKTCPLCGQEITEVWPGE